MILFVGHGNGNFINIQAVDFVSFMDIDEEDKAELIISFAKDRPLSYQGKEAQAIYSLVTND